MLANWKQAVCFAGSLSLCSLSVAFSSPISQATLHDQQVLRSPTDELWNIANLRQDLKDALSIMQGQFFEVWLGRWPTASDWTGAVMSTHVAASLNALTRFKNHNDDGESNVFEREEDLFEEETNAYFAQLTAYYFGEHAVAMRSQAHDDMLWVVLGWLESLKLIDSHNVSRREDSSEGNQTASPLKWHGTIFVPAFAHRSRIFYDIVSAAWDRKVCGGGLTWDPKLGIYKNTVTNSQFISASVGMYLYHTGDDIRSPYLSAQDQLASRPRAENDDRDLSPALPHDPAYLSIAKEANDWLSNINMTNDKGLFTDGFHVRSHLDPDGHRVYDACDLREEMVYTYNQGILLSGKRQLWEATGNISHLESGHALVRAVIAATGFPATNSTWKGIGAAGILTEFCDTRGFCSQDAQTFKGIFFHHLGLFCEPLPTKKPLVPRLTFVADSATASLHASSCRGYIPWVQRNAKAAWGTRNEAGIMGSWWGAPAAATEEELEALHPRLPKGVVDLRSMGMDAGREAEKPLNRDLNDRGRGRTVESHAGGLAALRTLYTLRMSYE